MGKYLIGGPLVMLALGAGLAHAATCDVFTDVDSTASYCNSVQWLKNRGVTLGCTATTYCPGDPVSRAQMALFMNRLGKALSPYLAHTDQNSPPVSIAANAAVAFCNLDIPAATYPRSARLVATGGGSAAASGLTGFVGYRPTGTSGAPSHLTAQDFAIPTATDTYTALNPLLSIPVATEYTASVYVNNTTGSPITLNGSACSMDLTVVNVNPAAPPY